MSVSRVSTPAHKRHSYSRQHRLTRESELQAVKRAGKRLKTEHIEAHAATSLLSYCRVAVVVAKYSHTIVERNRLRRRLRELARVVLIPELSGVDLVVRVLPDAYDVDFGKLAVEVARIRDWLMTGRLGE